MNERKRNVIKMKEEKMLKSEERKWEEKRKKGRVRCDERKTNMRKMKEEKKVKSEERKNGKRKKKGGRVRCE